MRICFCILFILLYCFTTVLQAKCVSIVISSPIKPYITLADYIKKFSRLKVYSIILPDDEEDIAHNIKLLKHYKCEVILSIGYRAAKVVSKIENKNKIFSFVLYPFTDPNLYSKFACGITLNIPEYKLAEACKKLEANPKVSIVYSDYRLHTYVDSIKKFIEGMGGCLISYRVRKNEDISKVLDNILERTDILLLIPDPMLSSEEIIEWIVFKAISKGKFVVGYNKFFWESGATAVLYINYKQTALKILDEINKLMETGKCETVNAEYDIHIRREVQYKNDE